MIELARFRHAQPAHLLVAALRGDGIAARVRDEQGEVVLYLQDAARFDEARALVELFLRNPADPRFAGAAWQASAPAQARQDGDRGDLDQPPLFSGAWLSSMGPVTRAVLGVTLVVFLAQQFMGPTVYRYLMFPESLGMLALEPWRAVTPMLLHFGLLHLAFNLLWWMELGRIIERFQSGPQLVGVTLVTAVVSAMAQFLASGPAFGGLSGVVYGLLGYLWIYGKVNPQAGYGLRREIVLFMLAWLVICYVGLAGIVANEAHLFGLLSGCALGAATGWYRREKYYRR
ncbi:rhomboid family intramembrane serine protease [Isoalcanivorax indicus]|uniref:rhomboid family intramembrane serine protease n=1 Tax=Isoalcanivorax indicus TaxID=2202653 RepID=UPI000DBA8E20|nr:rhomboid family intramembrane serine protease [Isoalcanivorax indicus]